jgi:EmrB/QacA subfamily drug resistance transporter
MARDKPWVLATAILGSSLAFIEGTVVNLALPAIQSAFGAGSTGVQWVANAYLLMLVAFMLIGGTLGDRYGLRRIFMLGIAVFALGALGAALAPSLAVLILARLVMGVGGALLVPASLALIGSHFERDERGRAIGTWAGASALTTAIGPVLGGWLVDRGGWPAVFLLILPLAGLTLAIAAWRVPASPPRHAEPLDYAGALLLSAALGLLVYALVDPGARGLRLGLLLGAGALAAAFVWRERGCAAPMLPPRIFRSRAFTGANLMTVLLYLALSGAVYFLPFNLIQVQGYSATQAGAAFLPFSVIMGLGSTFAGDLIRKFDARKVLTLGPLVVAAGFAALAIPGSDAAFATGFLPGILLTGIGMTISVAPLTTVVMGAVGEEHAGTASGVNNTAARLGAVLAVAALTAVAVWQFRDGLGEQLEASRVPPALAGQLERNADHLAELKAPAGTPPPLVAAVAHAVAQAYVATYRVLMLICAALAAASGLIAWVSLRPAVKPPRR